MTRDPLTLAVGGLVALLSAAVVTAALRACEHVVPDPPGEVVRVHPAIRAWDAGTRRER